MPDIEVRPGLVVNYRISGPSEAPALVLITGLGGLQEGWFRQVPYFEPSYRVLTLDNRGAGQSGVLDVPTTMRDMAEDVVAVMDAAGVAHAHIWGVSMGGKIAQELALGWPQRVDRLVLECTSAGEAHRVEGKPEGRLRGSHAFSEQDWLERLVPLIFGRAYREANASSMRAFARSRVRHPQDSVGAARQWEAYEAFDSWDRLPNLMHRTLVITGDEDALTHPANSERLVERLPNAELYVVNGAGHSLHIEKPEEVNAVIDAFLRGA
jgi:3-oxoadipate enol-lactonase